MWVSLSAGINDRGADTIDMMAGLVAAMPGKRLMYRDLISD